MIYLWLALIVIFAVVELCTPQLVSIWFAIGSLAGLISAWAGVDIWLQVVIAILISIIMILATRPLYKRYIKVAIVPTNSDRLIGQTAIVIEDINNLEARGTVKVQGQIWSARTIDDNPVSKDACVTIQSIEGVKLMVKEII